MERAPVKTLKVAICIPSYADPKLKFVHSLVNMIVYSLSHADLQVKGEPCQLELDTFIVSCSMLTESRHRLVAEAVGWDADYMLCLDADHVFPPDTLMRLLSHGLPAVGCNYPRRIVPTAPTAAANGGETSDVRTLLYTTEEKAEKALVEQCEHMGFGVLLLDMRIFDALQEWAQENEPDGNFLPLFKFEPTENKIGMIGEDVYFFQKLANIGIKPFVDHGLSWLVGHCSEIILTNNHAVLQRDAWKRKRRAECEKRDDRVSAIEAKMEEALANDR
jgi:hypothetical protein